MWHDTTQLNFDIVNLLRYVPLTKKLDGWISEQDFHSIQEEHKNKANRRYGQRIWYMGQPSGEKDHNIILVERFARDMKQPRDYSLSLLPEWKPASQ